MASGFHNNIKTVTNISFVTSNLYFQKDNSSDKKGKSQMFPNQRSRCQAYTTLFWESNLEIYSKSKDVNVKIVSKGHAYVLSWLFHSKYVQFTIWVLLWANTATWLWKPRWVLIAWLCISNVNYLDLYCMLGSKQDFEILFSIMLL